MASKAAIRLCAMLVFVACEHGVARAEQGTEQQREACTPDVFRLCGQFIPDTQRITTCLRNAGPHLSPACYAVFNPPQDDTRRSVGRNERRYEDQGLDRPARPSDDDDEDE